MHIGTEKTGTTTFQNWISRNRDALISQGVWYSKSLGLPNNRKLSVYARDEDKPEQGFWLHGITDVQKHREFRVKTRVEFQQEVQEALEKKCNSFVISNEHLHSRLTSDQMVERVRSFLGHTFQSIEVIAHLRPQVDVAVSSASTVSKGGRKISRAFFETINSNSSYFNYQKLIIRWERAFAIDNVYIVPFKRIPCMINFMVKYLNINRDDLTDIKTKNESLDFRTMAMINALNIPRFNRDQSLNKNREIFIERLPKEKKLAIGIELARSLQKKFDESNRELVKRRSDIEFIDLQPDWEKYDVPPNIDILEYECPFSEQLNALVQNYNAELKLEKVRTRLAESEHAIARQNFQNANYFLENASQLLREVESINNQYLKTQIQSLMNQIHKIKKKIDCSLQD